MMNDKDIDIVIKENFLDAIENEIKEAVLTYRK